MDFDAARLEKDGVEARPPGRCSADGAAVVRRGLPARAPRVADRHRPGRPACAATARTAGSRWRSSASGTIDAVEQLSRYLERIRLDPAHRRLPRRARGRRLVKPPGARPGRSARARAGSRSTSPSCRGAARARRSRCSVSRPRRAPSRAASAGRRGRGARTGRRPARCRARAGRRATGSVSDGPSTEALMCAGMSSGPSTVWVQYGASSGTAASNQVAKSRARPATRSRSASARRTCGGCAGGRGRPGPPAARARPRRPRA